MPPRAPLDPLVMVQLHFDYDPLDLKWAWTFYSDVTLNALSKDSGMSHDEFKRRFY